MLRKHRLFFSLFGSRRLLLSLFVQRAHGSFIDSVTLVMDVKYRGSRRQSDSSLTARVFTRLGLCYFVLIVGSGHNNR